MRSLFALVWEPPTLLFQFRRLGKVVDMANIRNDRGGLDRPRTHRGEDLPFARLLDNGCDLALQLLHICSQEPELLHKLTLLEDEAAQQNDIFHANAFSR